MFPRPGHRSGRAGPGALGGRADRRGDRGTADRAADLGHPRGQPFPGFRLPGPPGGCPQRPGVVAGNRPRSQPPRPGPGVAPGRRGARRHGRSPRLLEHPGRGPLPRRRLDGDDRGPWNVRVLSSPDRPGDGDSIISSWPWPGAGSSRRIAAGNGWNGESPGSPAIGPATRPWSDSARRPRRSWRGPPDRHAGARPPRGPPSSRAKVCSKSPIPTECKP